MTAQVVEAVFVANYIVSNFRALYGRMAGGYTKDFFQVARSGGDILGEVLPAPKVKGSKTDIEYVWPTGTSPGTLHYGGRWHLKWPKNNKPMPWTVGPAVTTEISIVGDPAITKPADADAEHARIRASVEPWLVAVKLAGEARRLHVRTYFTNPPAGLEDRALTVLPQVVQDAIARLDDKDGSDAVKLQAGAAPVPAKPRAARVVKEVLEALAREPNVLLVGPPGTGKSVALEDLRAMYERRGQAILFDPDVWGPAWQTTGPESRSEVLVFHPSYAYESFVAGLYPKGGGNSGIDLVATPGPLLGLAHWIGESDRQALLVLDEFNRGPAAAIFGDTLALLDKEKRSSLTNTGNSISRPYPAQQMPVPTSYLRAAGSTETVSDVVRLPASLHLVAAMNSTDRSVAPLDAAMRRRFAVIRVGPDYEVLREHFGLTPEEAAENLPTSDDISTWEAKSVSALGVQLLQRLNERIEFCLGEDFLLGHALLWTVEGATAADRLSRLVHSIDARVGATLRMTFLDQDDALAAILGVSESMQVNGTQKKPGDTLAYWKVAPVGLASLTPKRLIIQKLADLDSAGQVKALLRLAAA